MITTTAISVGSDGDDGDEDEHHRHGSQHHDHDLMMMPAMIKTQLKSWQ